MNYIFEIRAGEGGDDAKLFVNDLMAAYLRFFDKNTWKWKNCQDLPGISTVEVNAPSTLEKEAGGHRIQRIPPTEKRGRKHTSTVTVAVIPKSQHTNIELKKSDLRIDWFSGTGAGGQRRNKVKSSCRMTHIPTGITSVSQCRQRNDSYRTALEDLTQKINHIQQEENSLQIAERRYKQVGSGMRADKIRTYRFQDDQVKDHVSCKIESASKVMKGHFDLLW